MLLALFNTFRSGCPRAQLKLFRNMVNFRILFRPHRLAVFLGIELISLSSFAVVTILFIICSYFFCKLCTDNASNADDTVFLRSNYINAKRLSDTSKCPSWTSLYRQYAGQDSKMRKQ
jgi:hypothetical protein